MHLVMRRLAQCAFIKKCRKIHGSKYDYSQVVYCNSRTKIRIICPKHGEFYQISNAHLLGQGCADCAGKKRLNTKTFIIKANEIHLYKYNYSLVNYINNKVAIRIICENHGIFTQTPNDHLSGKGCMDCGGRKLLTINDFIYKAKKVHSDRYDYSLARYINSYTRIEIICRSHGSFFQTPNSHLSRRYGCPKCSYNCISKMEIEWLDKLNIPIQYRQKSIYINGKYYRVDAFDPITNTIYEFYGDYWHGNPLKYKRDELNQRNKKTFGSLYDDTVFREKIYKNANYNIISMWELDFKRNKI